MEKPETPLEIFSALSLMEYVRLMTAAQLIKNNTTDCAKFAISPDDYEKLINEPLQMPFLCLDLDYNQNDKILTVTPQEDFMPQYDNKIMREVILTFYENYKNRYVHWIRLLDD